MGRGDGRRAPRHRGGRALRVARLARAQGRHPPRPHRADAGEDRAASRSACGAERTRARREPGRLVLVARPDSRQAAQAAALSSAMAGAVDLSGLKARAEQRTPAGGAPQRPADPAGGGGPPAAGGGAAPAVVLDVTEETFQAEVIDRSMQVPVVVDLWAEWCGPCKQLSPVLEKLAAEGRGAWMLAKIDVDANPRISQAFQVQSIPHGHRRRGRPAGDVVPRRPARAAAAAVDRPAARRAARADAGHRGGRGRAAAARSRQPVEEPEDPRFVAAEDALERATTPAAAAGLRANPGDGAGQRRGAAALAQVKFLERAESADPSAIARADAAPDDVDAQIAAADAEVAAQDVGGAFDRLVRRSRAPPATTATARAPTSSSCSSSSAPRTSASPPPAGPWPARSTRSRRRRVTW